jgi:hydroxypyruvate isomerase
MPKFSANISMLFRERPLLERFAASAEAGFEAIEIQFPYSEDVADLAAAKDACGLEVAVFNLPVGDLLTGGPGLAAMPGREAEFAAAIDQALPYAEALGPCNVNVLAGWPPAEIERDRCFETLAGNLNCAAEAFEPLAVRVLTEAVNSRDRPGYFLANSAQAIDAIEAAGHENLAIEHDLYHMQIMEGDLIAGLAKLMPHIGHIQFADNPGRHQPGSGEINFPAVFAAIDASDYDGFAGAEYHPLGTSEASLDWLRLYRNRN